MMSQAIERDGFVLVGDKYHGGGQAILKHSGLVSYTGSMLQLWAGVVLHPSST